MAAVSTSFSPDIKIHLEIGDSKIRLADVLYDSATLFDAVEVPANTAAILVFRIDDREEREEILLTDGITKHHSLIRFSYPHAGHVPPRHFLTPKGSGT